MRFLNLTLPSLFENLGLDEALLLEAEAGASGEALRCWAWPWPAVVLGAGGVIADDVDEAACTAGGVPLARRSSGGGTVLLGSGCLNFSLILDIDSCPPLQQIGTSYRFILGRVANCLADLLPGIEPAGTSDLAAEGRKFSGNSQQRKRRFILHHGTILHRFDLNLIGRYLRLPPRRPDYRANRPHADFLINLPARPAELVARMQKEWAATEARSDWPEARVRQLVDEKFGLEEWVRRR